MPLRVRKFNAQVKDPQSGQMVPAGLLSSDSLQAIEAAESAAITEIQQKGTETKASIPDNYTELSDSVGELKTQLDNHIDDFDSAMEGISTQGTEVTGSIITVDSSDGEIDTIAVDASGAGTSIITRCGRNIYPKYSSGSSSGLSWTVDDDGEIEFTGTPTVNVLLRHTNLSVPCTGKAFSLAANNTMAGTSNQLAIICKTPAGNWQTNLTSVNKTANHAVYQSSDAEFTEFQIKLEKDVDWTGLKMKPMLVVGDTLGDYEAYNGQTYNVTLVDGIVQENIPLLDGVNTLWADNGDMTVKFEDVPNKIADYIAEYVAEHTEPYNERFYRYFESGNAKYLQVCFRSGAYYICYELHNAPAQNSNSDTWQLGSTKAYKIEDGTVTEQIELIEGGEYELSMRVHQSDSSLPNWDYCGGNNHGDENTVTFKMFIDGKQIDDYSTIAGYDFKRFNRIDAFEIAIVNMPTNDAQNNKYPNNADIDIAQHQKHWTFENGKVEVQQTLKFLEDLSLDVVLLAMCCAKRSQYPYGIRQGGVEIEDMRESGFTHITTRTNDASFFYFGDNATLNIKAKTDSPTTSALYINSTPTQNKLYYGYYQATNSGSPTQVNAGDIIQETTLYNAAFD